MTIHPEDRERYIHLANKIILSDDKVRKYSLMWRIGVALEWHEPHTQFIQSTL